MKREELTKVVEPERAKKPTKETRPIKEVPLITAEEFESVPAYVSLALLKTLHANLGFKCRLVKVSFVELSLTEMF